MTSLGEQIAAAHDRNEAALAQSLSAPKAEFDADALDRLRHFADFCKERGVRPLPAAPGTVAAFIRSLAHWATNDIMDVLSDIEALHSNNNLANPIATAAVRSVLEEILHIAGPRNWSKSERLLFAALPIEVRAIIQRREKMDSNAVRKAQNLAAELKQKLEALQPKEVK
jgi:hypothetical protein